VSRSDALGGRAAYSFPAPPKSRLLGTHNTNAYPQVLKTLARFIEGTPQVHTSDVVTSTFKQHELVTA